MKRALITLAVLAVSASAAIAFGGAGGTAAGKQYKIVFDNAFGLVSGADFKVGGVAVGQIKALDVRRSDDRAVATVEVSRNFGFGGMRSDAICQVKPQSLIGEYFIDCQPGTKGRMLPSGATLDYHQTQSPIPADLVASVMRLPERQRFEIILGELGAGLAARGDDLNATIRRAIPAIGATDKVLKILAANRETLKALARDSGVVMKAVGARHHDVGRFVVSARRTAEASAERRAQIAQTFHLFPGFLDQLQPTLADLGTAARLQTPALADLRAAAPSVRDLLATLRPFSRAAEPATITLGTASKHGRVAAKAAAPLVKNLRKLGANSPEVATNASFIARDLDDRSRAVEPDPRSPGGAGYTGFEALLQYIFDQSLSANIFDQRGYALKIEALIDDCGKYTTAEDAKADMARYRRCGQGLGPNQPGVTTADPSPPATAAAARKQGKHAATKQSGADSTPTPQVTATPQAPQAPGQVQQVFDQLPQAQPPNSNAGNLLDYLLGP